MIQQLSNEQLLDRTKKLAQDERQLTVEILRHLREIETRKLFLKLGFRSLFEYVVKELSYSEDAAYRRISAMRLTRDFPEVANKIESGALSLTAACKAQKFFRNVKDERVEGRSEKSGETSAEKNTEESAKAREVELAEKHAATSEQFQLPQSRDEKLKLIEKLEYKSTREVEKELLKLRPEELPSEKVRQITENKTEIKIVVDEDLKQKLNHLRNLLSHVNPSMTYRELIAYLADMGLKRIDPARQAKKVAAAKPSKSRERAKQVKNIASAHDVDRIKLPWPQRDVSGAPRVTVRKSSRYVPTTIRQKVWQRDGGRCTYIESPNSRRCSSTHLLQLDHIKPFAFGGEPSVDNLRLLCQQHNLLRLVEADA